MVFGRRTTPSGDGVRVVQNGPESQDYVEKQGGQSRSGTHSVRLALDATMLLAFVRRLAPRDTRPTVAPHGATSSVETASELDSWISLVLPPLLTQQVEVPVLRLLASREFQGLPPSNTQAVRDDGPFCFFRVVSEAKCLLASSRPRRLWPSCVVPPETGSHPSFVAKAWASSLAAHARRLLVLVQYADLQGGSPPKCLMVCGGQVFENIENPSCSAVLCILPIATGYGRAPPCKNGRSRRQPRYSQISPGSVAVASSGPRTTLATVSIESC